MKKLKLIILLSAIAAQAHCQFNASQIKTDGVSIGGNASNQLRTIPTGIAAGSCTLCNLTLDVFGRVTAYSNGSAGIGTVTSVSAGTWMNFTTITGAGPVNADSAAIAAYLLRRADSSATNGWVSKYLLTTTLSSYLTIASASATYLTIASAAATYQPLGTYVTNVTGTANRITSSGGTTPSIDIAATYVGQTSITTLGTLSIATWNATAIAAQYGGTGINTSASTGVAQVSSGTWSVSTALANGTTATTQALNDSTTLIANTAWVDRGYTYNHIYASDLTQIASTNTTSEEVIKSYKINANSLSPGDIITVRLIVLAGGGTSTKLARIRLNSSTSIAGTVYSTTSSTSASAVWINYSQIAMTGSAAQIGMFPGGQAVMTGVISSGSQSGSLSLASDIYVLITTQKGTGTDTFTHYYSAVWIEKAQ